MFDMQTVEHLGEEYHCHSGNNFTDRMWRIFPDSAYLSHPKGSLRKTLIKKAKKKMNSIPCCNKTPMYPLDTLKTNVSSGLSWYIPQLPCNQETKETTMRCDYHTPLALSISSIDGSSGDRERTQYLTQRVYDVYKSKKETLRHAFGLIDDDAPYKASDMVARIKEGRYIIEDEQDAMNWMSPLTFIRWRSPDLKQDVDGYEKAKALLKTARQAALDIISTLTPADGLKALQDFEAKSFQ